MILVSALVAVLAISCGTSGTVPVVPQLLTKTAVSADTNNIFVFLISISINICAAKLLIIYELTKDIGKKLYIFL